MKIITPPQIWSFFMHCGPSQDWDGYQEETTDEPVQTKIEREQFDYLKTHAALDAIKPIYIDQNASENHLGGDDLTGLVDDVLAAQNEDYRIINWYGPNAEVCVVGFKHGLMVGWLTPAEVEAKAQESHYARELTAKKRMWGPDAVLGVLASTLGDQWAAPETVIRMRSIGQLIKRGLCDASLLVLDTHYKYLLTVRQEQALGKPLEPAIEYPE